MAEQKMSMPAQLLIKFVANVLLVWLLAAQLDQYFVMTGGLAAYVTVGALLTLMNMLVRPLLHIITLPFKLFMSILTTIVVNGLFLWLTEKIVDAMDPTVVTFDVAGGWSGWLLVAVIIGLANWMLKSSLK